MTSTVCHYYSRILHRTLREFPKDEVNANARWLMRAGFIQKVSAGIYAYLPLGLRVLNKVEAIVRDEMERIGASEVMLPSLHPRELWDQTDRWNTLDVLYKLAARNGQEFCLGPTHEEVVTPAVRDLIFSNKSLPAACFQIQSKFRDEARARSGLLRGREFRMKDMYSFHLNQEDQDLFYEQVIASYRRIFERVGFGKKVVLTFASGGSFSKFSHEFQLVADCGEDRIYYAAEHDLAVNKEIVGDQEVLQTVFNGSGPKLEEMRSIEVGNIFKLGSRFTASCGFTVADSTGVKINPVMGCYGIGTSRLMGAIAETCCDEKGIVWPRSVAPYDIEVLVVPGVKNGSDLVAQIVGRLNDRYDLLIDDREGVRMGEKFADADLIGVPIRIVIGNRSVERGEIEVQSRVSGDTVQASLDRISGAEENFFK